MMKKIGINTVRFEKNGPGVKRGISVPKSERFSKRIKCPSCGAMLEKSCPNEMFCEIAVVKCPKCGAEIS